MRPNQSALFFPGLDPIWQEDGVATDSPREGGRVETPTQAALLEVWMGLRGYGIAMGRATEEEAAAALLPKLRKALSLEAPVAPPPISPEGVGGGEEGTAPPAPVSAMEVRTLAKRIEGLGEGLRCFPTAQVSVRTRSASLRWCVGRTF